jgi:sulfur-oxidizing protein SoxY
MRLAVAAGLLVGCGAAASAEPENWPSIQRMMFGDREVRADGKRVVEVFAPQQADDAAVVPVVVRTWMLQRADRYVRHVWLVIDNNPSPVGVKFTFTPESGRADIETRVRLESASPIRAIAELNDGSLWMHSVMVFGAGGCSSPSAKNDQALRNMGKLKFSVESDNVEASTPTLAQLRISHPQFSGMGSGDPPPPRFVRQVRVTYAGKVVMTADVDFTISENPHFRFYFVPTGDGELRAEVVDTEDLRVEERLAVKVPGTARR